MLTGLGTLEAAAKTKSIEINTIFIIYYKSLLKIYHLYIHQNNHRKINILSEVQFVLIKVKVEGRTEINGNYIKNMIGF